MTDPSVKRLQDHIALWRAVLTVFTAPDDHDSEALRAATACEIASRTNTSPDRQLAERFGLSAGELEIVTLLASAAMDRSIRRSISELDESGDLTTDRLRELVFGVEPSLAGQQALRPHGALRRLALIERSDAGGPLVHDSRRTWTVSQRVLNWLHGDTSVDAELARIVRIPEGVPTIDRLAIASNAAEDARRAVDVPGAVVLAIGQAGLGRRSLLAAAAAEAGLQLLEIDATRLAKDPDALALQLRLIARECKLLAKVPLVRQLDALVVERDASRVDLVGSELASELSTAVLATCGANRPQLQWRRPVITIEMKAPTTVQCAELWSQALTDADDRFAGVDARQLATLFPIAPALVGPVVAAARIHACDRIDAGIRAGLRALLDNRIGHVARRLDVTQTWNDLVIDRDQHNALIELVARIRERSTVYEQWGFADKVGRGLGVAALFSGPPGTGKTMVAGLIAHELGLELYQVDLSKLVSKYIGETEKQLGELFDAAEAGHAVLLFDEADALFGKRTEVRSSNDRYANLETNYLLQRLESFTGICLLTSNHETHIDPAFQRRLALHMRFEMPDEKMRANLWQAMLPAAAPVESGINFADLARRYEMSGGYIRNAALRAAFLAADAQQSIGHDLLQYTAQLEYEGMGRVL